MTGSDPSFRSTPGGSEGFFDRNSELRPEIIEGIIRESQIGVLAGTYGIGKSPLLADLAIHTVHGVPWCGRRIQARPVIAFDFENGGPAYRKNLKNIAARLKLDLPRIPDQMTIHLANDLGGEAHTAELFSLMDDKGEGGVRILEKELASKPDALVIIDPVELFYLIDKMKGTQILRLYGSLKTLLGRFPEAAILLTFNLRKKDRRAKSNPSLMTLPRDWLEDVSGSLDILNRCDVRLGVDFYREDVRVINGVRRGEDMHPVLFRPIGEPDNLAGFERVLPSELDPQIDLLVSLTIKQKSHWVALPAQYRFEEVADKVVPRSSLSRLHERVKSLGILEESDGIFRKLI